MNLRCFQTSSLNREGLLERSQNDHPFNEKTIFFLCPFTDFSYTTLMFLAAFVSQFFYLTLINKPITEIYHHAKQKRYGFMHQPDGLITGLVICFHLLRKVKANSSIFFCFLFSINVLNLVFPIMAFHYVFFFRKFQFRETSCLFKQQRT